RSPTPGSPRRSSTGCSPGRTSATGRMPSGVPVWPGYRWVSSPTGSPARRRSWPGAAGRWTARSPTCSAELLALAPLTLSCWRSLRSRGPEALQAPSSLLAALVSPDGARLVASADPADADQLADQERQTGRRQAQCQLTQAADVPPFVGEPCRQRAGDEQPHPADEQRQPEDGRAEQVRHQRYQRTGGEAQERRDGGGPRARLLGRVDAQLLLRVYPQRLVHVLGQLGGDLAGQVLRQAARDPHAGQLLGLHLRVPL